MQVAFRHTAARKYAVVARRPRHLDVETNPAPGYDDQLPHDLCHFLVERHWRLRHGIFGQVAAGGDAGTFRPVGLNTPGENKRERSRRVRRVRRRPTGDSEVARSEHLASVVQARWEAHRHGRPLPEWYELARSASGAPETAIASALETAVDLADRWQHTEVGRELVLDWF